MEVVHIARVAELLWRYLSVFRAEVYAILIPESGQAVQTWGVDSFGIVARPYSEAGWE